MSEFFQVLTPQEAWQRLELHISDIGRTETVFAQDALGRVTSMDILAPEDLPPFPRSAMDGYAVRAEDTHGASEGLPAYVQLAGEVPMGQPTQLRISPDQAALIHTGGVVPRGANAVVMVENTRKVDDSTIELTRSVAQGENVIQPGEDIRHREMLLAKGHRVRAQDIGGLLALGISEVTVFQKPIVAIISTGDELVHPETKVSQGQVRNINTYTSLALTIEAGGIPLSMGIIPDNYKALREAAQRSLEEADAVVISAGSSVSTRDLTADVINSLGNPGVLVHGVSLKPGKPTIIAFVNNKPMFGLAGNPVSAMITYDLFVGPAVNRLGGSTGMPIRQEVIARLTRSIPSATGREDYVAVRLLQKDGETWAEPVFGKSNLTFTLVRADGLARIPLDQEGMEMGETVAVRVF